MALEMGMRKKKSRPNPTLNFNFKKKKYIFFGGGGLIVPETTSFRRVKVPYPQIVINLSMTYEKLNC